jgi:hypothetical protein
MGDHQTRKAYSRQIGKGITCQYRLTLSDGTIVHDAEFQSVNVYEAYRKSDSGKSEMNFRDSYKYSIMIRWQETGTDDASYLLI